MIDIFAHSAILLLTLADFGVWLLLGLLALIAAGLAGRYLTGRWLVRLARGAFLLAGIFLLAVSAYQVWFTHRPIPPDITRQLYPGVIYHREARTQPRPLMIHIIEIDLSQPGLQLHVTPGDPTAEYPLTAKTTSQFLQENGLHVAVNAAFFTPWWSQGLWDYYPHPGDPVTARGLHSSAGVTYGVDFADYATVYLSAEQQPQFDPPAQIYNALSGNYLFIRNGEIDLPPSRYHADINPRTVLAFSADLQTMLWIVIDGRQPNFSEGVDMFELADIVQGLDVGYALNLDGGGSTTLVAADENGQPVLLNSPVDHRIPGRERYIANHLGLSVTQPD